MRSFLYTLGFFASCGLLGCWLALRIVGQDAEPYALAPRNRRRR